MPKNYCVKNQTSSQRKNKLCTGDLDIILKGLDIALEDQMSWQSRHTKGQGNVLEVQTKYQKNRYQMSG